MEKAAPSSITIEEAVAEMVNMNYVPAGFTLFEMIAAFQEEAEVEYENARIDRLPEDQITPLRIRMDSCQARHALAQLLMESLNNEVNHPENSIIVLANDSTSQQRLTFDSVSDWAADKYGIGISRRPDPSAKVEKHLNDVRWEDITIKIWADYRIGYSAKKGEYLRSHFRQIGLMGNVKKVPNHLGQILIALSQGKNFPAGKYSQPIEKTAISKLRRVLYNWIDLSEDPFIPYNEYDGWKPRFKLVDGRNNAVERAQKKATHVSLDENRVYKTDDDGDDD